jgi:plastocyanin
MIMLKSRPMTLPALMAILVLVLAACGSSTESTPANGGDGGDGAAAGETVSLAGSQFTPSNLEIAPGTTVTFTDTSGHTVTEGQDGVAIEDPIVDEAGGADIEVTFDEPGTYNITCTIHPTMNMTIIVTD